MIKGIILDVDGVLVGGKKGFNWPDPNPQVIQILKSLREQGIFVSLCTGKGTFAIKNIVESACLNNLHIGDGGAVVIDFLNNTVIESFTIENKLTTEVIKTYLKTNTYLELYTVEGYYVQKNQVSDITTKHSAILYREPVLVNSILDEVKNMGIVKIMPVAQNEVDKKRIMKLFEPYKEKLTLQWGVHLTALPYQFGIITLKDISKKQAAETISKQTGVSFKNTLGVGDGMTDWNFMELCKYAGAMGNSTNELKELVKTKGEGNYFVGGSVDENGILSIFKYF